jgi:hypothetical protein
MCALPVHRPRKVLSKSCERGLGAKNVAERLASRVLEARDLHGQSAEGRVGAPSSASSLRRAKTGSRKDAG